MFKQFNCSFHHLGVACRNLDLEQKSWTFLGYTQEGPEFEDPIQCVRIRFLVGPGPRLELIAPMTTDSPVEGVLQRRNKIYHQGFLTPCFEQTLEAMEANGSRRIDDPVPAIAFGGRQIVFILLANGNLIELIEADQT